MSFADIQNMVSAWGIPGTGRSLIIHGKYKVLHFFLFMTSVMAASTGFAEDVSPCPGDTVPIMIMTPGHGDSRIKSSAAEIPDSLPHFRAFVTAVTEHIAARLAKDKLCIKSAERMEIMKNMENIKNMEIMEIMEIMKSMEIMKRHERDKHSLLQFVHWPLAIHGDFFVPTPPPPTTGGVPVDCWISSPWIDLVVMRRPVPSIRSVIRWNERQLLVDQALLAGAHNAPRSMPMPLESAEYGYFAREYEESELWKRPAAKPIEERVPSDILWLFRRSGFNERAGPFFGVSASTGMHRATEKGAEGYTKLVLALIDRCFAPSEAKRTILYYSNILDAADLIPLERYKIDMPIRRIR
jgi:hypothetical protein